MTAPAPLRLGGHLGLSGPDRPLLVGLGRSTSVLDQIDALADHGFSGVLDLALKLRPADEIARMAARMAQRGLLLSGLGGDPQAWNTPLWSRRDVAAQREQDASVAASAALAARFGGGAGAVVVAGLDPSRGRAEQLEAMADNLRRVAPRAADAGLVLLVEPIASARIPGMLLDEMEHGVAMVEAIASPAVRLLFDIGHAAMMALDVPASLRRWGGLVGGIQAADVPGRIAPGQGTLDWRAITAAIRSIGYGGVVELEFEPVDPTPGGAADMVRAVKAALA